MMENKSLYTIELWQRFKAKFGLNEEQFKLKKYPQLDPYFNFLSDYESIHELVADPTLQRVAKHPFLPFVKILTKTPRYRYQEDELRYSLDTKIRPISFAAHFDSYLYAFYAFAITEKYQQYIRSKSFHESILAYRTDLGGLCNIQFAKEAFNRVQDRLDKIGRCTAIALDISGYFDNIDHFILKEKWCKVLELKELPIDQYKVFRSLTKYAYLNYNSFLKHYKINLKAVKKKGHNWQSLLDLLPDSTAGELFREKLSELRDQKLIVSNLPKKNKGTGDLEYRGIPQGSSMSAVLSNIYLIDFDDYLYKLGLKYNFSYRRYCDDLLIICSTEDAEIISELALSEIEKYKLTIQEKKAERIDFMKNSKGLIRGFNHKKIKKYKAILNHANEGRFYKSLQYLGFEFNGQNTYIRPGSLSRYFQKMKRRLVKTIMMSYSSKSKKETIMKKQLFERYSHLGKRNFLSYAQDASKKTYVKSSGVVRLGLDSIGIKRQLARHFKILELEIGKTTKQRYELKKISLAKKKAKGQRVRNVIFKT